MIEAIKITKEEFTSLEAQIHNELLKLNDYNSPTYQKLGLPTKDGNVLLLKPKRPNFVAAISHIVGEWEQINKSELLIIE